jgi:hypothetical protein
LVLAGSRNQDRQHRDAGRWPVDCAGCIELHRHAWGVDGRTQAEKDLDAVQAAIRTLIAGGAVQQYSIGNRQLSRYQLSQLIELESKLKAELKREQKAELMANGLGNPHNLFVRF